MVAEYHSGWGNTVRFGLLNLGAMHKEFPKCNVRYSPNNLSICGTSGFFESLIGQFIACLAGIL